jgi:hypothetical protein
VFLDIYRIHEFTRTYTKERPEKDSPVESFSLDSHGAPPLKLHLNK